MEMVKRDKIRARPQQIKPFHQSKVHFVSLCSIFIVVCRFIALIELLSALNHLFAHFAQLLFYCLFFFSFWHSFLSRISFARSAHFLPFFLFFFFFSRSLLLCIIRIRESFTDCLASAIMAVLCANKM